ncbi:N-acetyltransferase [Streptomyces longisporoflavus]|uniref:GNAT family N-acetyltransferase n=1 Tax=Streptomyces longisporoflavus TaxID=28044 RepID=UPI00167D08CC|nr:GNAT family N-acetyltransferase [Streptomyces longisporoflavus]GGV41334.1 N-acetyltransferase [Streptomyces longisporoflavus]
MAPPPITFPWPTTLTTDRLVLRPIEPGDVPAMTRLWTDTEVRRHLGGPVDEETLRLREQHCVGARGAFCVTLRADGPVVGGVQLEPDPRRAGRAEVSYQLLPEHWGFGYGREAVAAVVGWACEATALEGSQVVAVTQEANGRSRRLLESIGMERAETFVEWGAAQVLYVAGPRRPDRR